MDLQQSLQRALHYLQAGPPERCVQVCNGILTENPGLIQALYLRGCAAFETDDNAQSINDLGIVHDNHPEHLHAAYYLGRSLLAAGRPEEALAPLQISLDESELEVRARYKVATCLTHLRRRSEAIDHYQVILRSQPENSQVAANLASLLERENRLEEAASWTDRALSMDPANETALMTRAILDRRNGSYSEAALQFRQLTNKITNPINCSIVWNQLGQCLEDQGEWDEAFSAFSKSNHILKTHHPGSQPDPRAPHGLQTLSRIQEWLMTNPMTSWDTAVNHDEGGIAFLVGFPRSGTTLLDRMLAAHPDIEVLEEKSLFSSLHQDWSKPGSLETLAEVNEAQVRDAREIYRQEMTRNRCHQQRSLVIDKLPLNLAYLFLIYRLFPQAPVIFMQRHPLDVCISCYFQAFELEASMAYFLDMEDTVQYYHAVMQVAVASMDQVGNPLQSFSYEDLVAGPEAQLKDLIGFLGLEMDDSMLDYRRRDPDTSNTPSYQQVSQPLHTRSIGKWRHYSKQLESSLADLRPWMKHFGYTDL